MSTCYPDMSKKDDRPSDLKQSFPNYQNSIEFLNKIKTPSQTLEEYMAMIVVHFAEENDLVWQEDQYLPDWIVRIFHKKGMLAFIPHWIKDLD